MRIALSVVVVLAACGSKDKPAPAAPAPRPLPWLKMTIDVPADAKLEPGVEGDRSAMVSWTDTTLVINAQNDALFHKDIADAIKVGAPKAIIKQGNTADGWELVYDDDMAGDTYHYVVIHRHIAEAEWECTGGGKSDTAVASIVKACATLRPS